MKTLTILLLIMSFVGYGQNTNFKISKEVQKIEYEHSLQKVNRFDKEFKKADSAWGNTAIAISGFSPNEMLTLSRQKITIYLDYFKVTDTIWVMSGKKNIGIPTYKFLALLGYEKDDEKLCPVCGKDFLWNTSSARNKNGYIWKQYNCEHCNYHEVHYYTKSEQ